MRFMIDAITNGTWKTPVTADDVSRVLRNTPCPTCIIAKRNSLPIPPSITDPKTLEIAELISGDIIGPISPCTRNGHKYIYLFCDRRTGYLDTYTSESKAGFITALQDVCKAYTKHGHIVRAGITSTTQRHYRMPTSKTSLSDMSKRSRKLYRL